MGVTRFSSSYASLPAIRESCIIIRIISDKNYKTRLLAGLQQPVGDIYMIQEVLRRGLLLQYVDDGHAEAWYCVETFGPLGKAIDIREGCDLTFSEDAISKQHTPAMS